MKILKVCCYFYPAFAYGGPVVSIYDLAKELVKKGHEVTVFTTDVLDERERVKKREEEIEGIKIFRFPTISNRLSWNFRGFIAPTMFLTLARQIKNYDLVHIYEHYSFPTLVAFFWAKRYKMPYIYSPLGSLMPIKERGRQFIKIIFDLCFRKKILGNAAFITALSEKEKEYLLTLGIDGEKIVVLPNGIDLSEFSNLPSKEEARKNLGLKEEEVGILFIGRIYKVKGLDLLIKAVAKLPKELKEKIKVFIVGPSVDNYQKELEKLVKKLGLEGKITFPGAIYTEDKLNYLAASDFYVQPSYSEGGVPISVLEAMASGLPVLVTEGCNAPEIRNFKTGLIVKPDVLAIFKELVKLLENSPLRKKLGENGKKLVKERFSLEKNVENLEKIYEKATNHNQLG